MSGANSAPCFFPYLTVTATVTNSEAIERCPCGSGAPFDQCCEPIIAGETIAQTAEQLMRSRYAAYTTKNERYLLDSWHHDTRPQAIDLSDRDVHWIRLKIVRTFAGTNNDHRGEVEFVATYKQQGRAHKLHEISQFERNEGMWRYVSGKLL